MALVRAVFKDLVRKLKEAQVPSPTREARLLLAHLFHTAPSRVYLFWDYHLEDSSLEKLDFMLAERLQGTPLQYVLGEWEFLSLPFEIEKGVFIPRFDTEAWVEEAILLLRFRAQRETPITICDVGCGSGVIGISSAFWIEDLRLYGVDVSPKAVALSRRNAQKLGVAERSFFIQSDLFQVFSGTDIRFDAILSNPPYVPWEEWCTLSAEIREYEPREALVAGEGGLAIISRIIDEGVSFLKKGGFLILEHDPRQQEWIKENVGKNPCLEYLRGIKDYNGRIRASIVQRREED